MPTLSLATAVGQRSIRKFLQFRYRHLSLNIFGFRRDALGPNQACTLFGSAPGSDQVSGKSYLNVAFGLDTSDLWRRNFVVLLGFLLVFQLTQMLLIEYFPVRILGLPFYSSASKTCHSNTQVAAAP